MASKRETYAEWWAKKKQEKAVWEPMPQETEFTGEVYKMNLRDLDGKDSLLRYPSEMSTATKGIEFRQVEALERIAVAVEALLAIAKDATAKPAPSAGPLQQALSPARPAIDKS